MATVAAVKKERAPDWHTQVSQDAGAGGRPVDLVHLSRFTLGSRELEREVLQLFRVQSRIYLGKLEAAQDHGAWVAAAHTIKGSAKGIGAWAVAWAAETAEQIKNAPGGEQARAARDQLSEAVEQACAFIDELLADH